MGVGLAGTPPPRAQAASVSRGAQPVSHPIPGSRVTGVRPQPSRRCATPERHPGPGPGPGRASLIGRYAPPDFVLHHLLSLLHPPPVPPFLARCPPRPLPSPPSCLSVHPLRFVLWPVLPSPCGRSSEARGETRGFLAVPLVRGTGCTVARAVGRAVEQQAPRFSSVPCVQGRRVLRGRAWRVFRPPCIWVGVRAGELHRVGGKAGRRFGDRLAQGIGCGKGVTASGPRAHEGHLRSGMGLIPCAAPAGPGLVCAACADSGTRRARRRGWPHMLHTAAREAGPAARADQCLLRCVLAPVWPDPD